MIIPVKWCIKVFGTDSFDFTLTWKDSSGSVRPLSTWLATMTFFKSKTDRTVVKIVDSTTGGSDSSRIDLSDSDPNIYVFIQSDETFVESNPPTTTGGFLYIPGYYTLDLGPQDAQDTMDRLTQGSVHYES